MHNQPAVHTGTPTASQPHQAHPTPVAPCALSPTASRLRRSVAPSLRRFFTVILTFLAVAAALAQQPAPLRSDSRTPYVHRLSLYDADGTVIDPRDPQAQPYSPARTCGKCHEIDRVRIGWHFNAGRPGVDSGRPGEPWIFVDRETGTQIPLSLRRWPLAWQSDVRADSTPVTWPPDAIGLTRWQFVQRFGRHLPGGGIAEPDEDAVADDPDAGRWTVAGMLEIDCLTCHAADARYDAAETARQIEHHNLRWAATAAAGLGVIRGEAKRLPDDFDPLLGPDPDRPDLQPPQVAYHAALFDADDRVLFDLTRRPPPARCEFCHTTRPVDPTPELSPVDVHLAAGLTCTDCHRAADIGHDLVRGYESEASRRKQPWRAAYTCRGCHLGAESASQGHESVSTGLYGAPHPQHRGIPAVHFQRLTCTACHSGLPPRRKPWRVQTSLAHALGVPSRDRHPGDPPAIYEPVFARDRNGRIAPFRLLWPSFWARLAADGTLQPLKLEIVRKALQQAQRKCAEHDRTPQKSPDAALDRTTVKAVLKTLAGAGLAGTPAYVHDGRVYRLDALGELTAGTHPAAGPYLWPLAHDVRPAAMALGARGCGDCHADDAPFVAATVPPAGEALRASKWPTMASLAGLDAAQMAWWGRLAAAKRIGLWVVGAAGVLVVLSVLLRLLRWTQQLLTPGGE